jgi:hypothetical protein
MRKEHTVTQKNLPAALMEKNLLRAILLSQAKPVHPEPVEGLVIEPSMF